MSKYAKAGLLILTLVIPALIFTFLRFFATNHYNIPYYHPALDSSGEFVMSGRDTVFYKVGGFRAFGVNGDVLSEDLFDRKLSVIAYTPYLCDDGCKLVIENLERIYELTKNIGSLQIVSVCDSISLGLSNSSAVNNDMGWLVAQVGKGDLSEVLDINLRLETGRKGAGVGKLMLVDEQRHIRGYYDGFDNDEIDRLMAEIKILDMERRERSLN